MHAMKVFGRVYVYFNSLLNLTVDWRERSASCIACFTSSQSTAGTH